MQRFLTAGILFVACATGAAAGPIEDAFQRGDYALAVQLLRSLAEQGDVGAQYNLGVQSQYFDAFALKILSNPTKSYQS